jgi:hypothetical protein
MLAWDENAFYRAVGLDPAEGPDVIGLALRVFARRGIVEVPGIRAPAVFVGNRSEILVRRGLTPGALSFVVAHELAEWLLERDHWIEDDRESQCDHIAATLTAPGAALRAAFKAVGRDLPAIARAFRTTESIVALRTGEVTSTPVALAMPHRIRYAGDPWGWPSEDRLRLIARGRLSVGEIERTPLTDRARRVLLSAA